MEKKYEPNQIDWQVFLDMIPYLEIPCHEYVLPNVAKSHDILRSAGSALRSTPDLDLEAWLEQLEADLTESYREEE